MQGEVLNFLFKRLASLCLVSGALLLSLSSSAVTISSLEIRNLENGQVIQNSIKGRSLGSSRSIKGSESKILIHAPAQKVWQVLDEKENLPRIIRQVKEARVIEDNGNSQKVVTSVKVCSLLPKFDYVLSFDNSEKFRRMKFRKTDGCFKELFGYFEFIPYGNSTILGYRIYSDPGFYIPKFVCSGLKEDAKNIMRSIKKEAEK